MPVHFEFYVENLERAKTLHSNDFHDIKHAAYCEDGEGNTFGMITSAQGDQ